MSLGTSNRDGGKTSESGHLRALGKIVSGDIITGLNAVQRAAGVNMSVDIQVGDAFVRRSDGTYSHPVFNDAVYNQVISAADGSNPRRDILVLYVDYGQSPSTLVSNNTNGVVKIKVVDGTPAGSPTDPSDAAIQSSVGSGNPWTKLARVRVPAGQTSISNSLIDDLRTLITNKPNTINTAAIKDNTVTSAKVDLTTFGLDMGDLAMNTATINVTGLSFKPRKVEFFFKAGTATNGIYAAMGTSIYTGKHHSTAVYTNGSAHRRTSSSADSILLTNASTDLVRGKVTAWNNDGFTISLSTVGGGGDVFAWTATA